MPRTMQNTIDMTLLAYMDGLSGYAMFLTHNYANAADLVQETYLRALKCEGTPAEAQREGLAVHDPAECLAQPVASETDSACEMSTS